MGVDTGDRLSFVGQEDGSVVVKPITRHVRELAGLLHRPGQQPVSIGEMDEGIARRMKVQVRTATTMIGLDTNVLVRYLTRDEPAQYAKVVAFIDAAIDRGEHFVVNTTVLCELEWVSGNFIWIFTRGDRRKHSSRYLRPHSSRSTDSTRLARRLATFGRRKRTSVMPSKAESIVHWVPGIR